LAWIQDEPAATRVEDLLTEARQGITLASWSVINAGEVFYQLSRRRGQDAAEGFWAEVHSDAVPIRLVSVTNGRVRMASRIKADHRVSYADAFAVALALELGQPLVTGDGEIRNAAQKLNLALEWLGDDS
jgi:predicted nucleic acid-binding protein